MSVIIPPLKFAWKTIQVIDDRNPPTLNTLHEVFSATGGVRLIALNVIQSNTPVGMEEIDIVITLDGIARTYDASVVGGLADSTEYAVIMYAPSPTTRPAYDVDIADTAAATWCPAMLVDDAPLGDPIVGHTIKVEVRQTSAIAAGARIRTKATYEVLEAV